ncbi:hypothetical protein [Methylobacterium sp. J-068]|uniref:hypothetical protein n=1 Tax=Methylobacterium sp. J-068 TaxID=2836649 RepID=UPI001FB97BD3|nr:hypothetical protein [Methylobacterium sp. J-068]MCJ2035770.1 hypothetical protein [Methylobacterium sp. J-068]
MSEGTEPSASDLADVEKLSEVSRLATLLADQVLDAQIMSRPVPNEHIRSLLEAALLLQEHGQELPSLLGQIMHGISAEQPHGPAEAQQTSAEDEATGRLAWMFRPFQGP